MNFYSMYLRCKDEAVYQYNQGNLEEGKRYEKESKFFLSLYEQYQKEGAR